MGNELHEHSRIALTTGARKSTIDSRMELFPFCDTLILENGGLILEKNDNNFVTDSDWWNELVPYRRVLEEFGSYLVGQYGLASDSVGRTTMLRYREIDNPEKELGFLLQEAELPKGLILTYNLGHYDIIPKQAGKNNARLFLNSKYHVSEDAAAGDDWNDIELLSNVMYAFLMGNSPDKIKNLPEAKNWVTVPSHFEGINTAISLMIEKFR